MDDLNRSPGQLGLRTLSLHLINARRLLSDTLTWKKPSPPPRRNYWRFDRIVFVSHSAGWLRARRVRPGPRRQVGRFRVSQGLDSNQGAGRCQENRVHSGPGLGPSVTSARRTLLRDSVAKSSLKSTRYPEVGCIFKGILGTSQMSSV